MLNLTLEHGPNPSPEEKALVDLFNLAHSEEAFMGGVDLAFLLRRKPRLRHRKETEGRGRHAIVGWLHGQRLAYRVTPIEVIAGPSLAILNALESPAHVVLATPNLPPVIWSELNARGYYREIPGNLGQRFGWQAETLKQAREWVEQDSYLRETVGLLPRPGQPIEDGPNLLLVDVNYQWVPLSEVGAHGRTGGIQLLGGTPIYFVEKRERRILELHPEPHVSAKRIHDEWGPHAAARARTDYPSIVVRAVPSSN